MSSETTAEVRIVGDASGVAPAVQETKGEISGLSEAIAAMSAQMAALGETMAATMAPATAATAEMATEMKMLIGETEKEAFSLREVALSAREGLESLHEMRESLMGFGELLLAAFAVEALAHFAEGIAEASEKSEHLSQQLGVPVAQVQALTAATAATGVPMDALVKGLGLIDKKFETEPALFKKLGIELPKNASQMQILNATMDRFKGLDDGPVKTALALELMGRNGAALIPFLNKGADGLAELTKEAVKYGAVNAEASESGLKLAESMNEGHIAMMGLKLTLSDAFAPLLKEMVDGLNSMVASMTESYKAGGTAKIIFTAITGTLQVLGSAIAIAAQALGPLGDLFVGISNNLDTILPIGAALATLLAGPYVVAAASALIATVAQSTALIGMASAFEMDGIIAAISLAFSVFTTSIGAATAATLEFTIALLANPLTWVAVAASAAAAGLVWLAQHVRSTSDAFDILKDVVRVVMEVIKAEILVAGDVVKAFGAIAYDAMTLNWGAVEADWTAGLNTVVAEVKSAATRIKAIQDDMKSHLVFGGKTGASEKVEQPDKPHHTGTAPNLEHQAKPKKEKTEKGPSEVEIWKQQLAEKLLLEENWGIDEQAFSLKFWEQKLSLAKAGSKEELEIRREISTLKKQLGKQETAEELARIKELTAAALDGAKTEQEIAKLGIQQKLAGAEEAAKAGRLSAVELERIRRDLNAQLRALDVDLENQTFALKMKALKDELDIAHLSVKDRDAVNRQIELLEKQHLDRMRLLNAQGDKAQNADDAKVLDAKRARYAVVAKTFGDALGQMATFQKGFAATIDGLWNSLFGSISQGISRMVQNWITALATQSIASEAQHAKEILGHAKAGAAAAYHAVVGIPIVGPILAPPAAAVAFAGIMAFSAEGGMGTVPYDNAPFLLHKNEMVLPAGLANPLREMLGGGGFALPAGLSAPLHSMLPAAANTNAPYASNEGGGDNHFHYHDHTDRGLTPAQIRANHIAGGDAVKMAHRKGAFVGTGLKL